MSRVIACTACQKKLKVREEYLGKRIKCPSCGAAFIATIEATEPAPASPPPAPTSHEVTVTKPLPEPVDLREIQCSHCYAKMQVPASMLGKRIHCPTCNVTVTAREGRRDDETIAIPFSGEEIQPQAGPPKLPPAIPPKIPDRDDAPIDDDAPWDEPSGKKRRRDDPDDDDDSLAEPRRKKRRQDDDDLDDDDDSWDRRRPKRRRRDDGEDSWDEPGPGGRSARPDVSGKLMPPAICLAVTGVFGILVNLFQVVMAIFNPRFLQENNAFGAAPPAVSAIFGFLFTLVAVLTVAGAFTMFTRRLYPLSMAGAILAMVNIGNCCCILGLPFGIWALIVLCLPEVKEAYE